MRRSVLYGFSICLLVGGVGLAVDPAIPAGETIFKTNKCTMCHKYVEPEAGAPVDSIGPPNLWNVGDRHDAAWMTKFLKKEVDQHGKKHKVLFKGSAEELKTLTDWLATLKAPKKADTTKSEERKTSPIEDPKTE